MLWKRHYNYSYCQGCQPPISFELQALVVVIYLQAFRKTWAGVQTTYTEETQLMNCFATQRKNSISSTKYII